MPLRFASCIKSATMRCQTRRRWYSNNRRLHVLGEARMSCGRSSQRHPVGKTYKIPLRTSRSSARGRPVRAGRGIKRWSRFHWASVTSERYGLRGMLPNVARQEFRQQLPFLNHENQLFLGIKLKSCFSIANKAWPIRAVSPVRSLHATNSRFRCAQQSWRWWGSSQ